MTDHDQKRVVVDYVGPQVHCGRFPIKRAVGETVAVVAHAFAAGHDQIRVEFLYRKSEHTDWTIRVMDYQVNDEWSGSFRVTELGRYLYTARAWADAFGTWRQDLQKKLEAGQDIGTELRIGAVLLGQTANAAQPADAERLRQWARALEGIAAGSPPSAIRLGPAAPGTAGDRPPRAVPGTRPADRRQVHLARRDELRRAGPAGYARPYSARPENAAAGE
ncbi:MAG: DUF3416 domain-containing protein [Planctomycetes bacterium]|nr:DUF3416 domain-containing protein [Planctomycetota bacterium]